MRDGSPDTTPEFRAPFLEWVPCDLCGRNVFTIRYPGRYSDNDFGADRVRSFMYASDDKARGNIVRCNNCGLVYLNPRDKDVAALYQFVPHDEYYLSSRADRLATAENDFKQLEQVCGTGGRRLLDVGCSYGFFLDVVKSRGWDGYGCELSREQFEFARERHRNVHNQELARCPFEKNSFDVITLYDVIEHLASPTAFVAQAREFLKPGGFLVLETPDVSSVPARIMGRFWLNFVRMHLYYFSPNTISQMLVKNGFEIVRIARHRRVIQLGVAIKWLKKYPWLYVPARLLLGGQLLRNVKLYTRLSGNMVVYAKKI